VRHSQSSQKQGFTGGKNDESLDFDSAFMRGGFSTTWFSFHLPAFLHSASVGRISATAGDGSAKARAMP
jgi:hypothetical protein